MERLTGRSEKGTYIIGSNIIEIPISVRRVLDKLAEYEDAEEQGLLIKRPCKVGDTVYLHHRAFANTIVRCVVIGFAWWGTDGFCVKVYSKEHGYGNTDVSFSEFGKTVFLTREAAEEALKGASHD